MVIIHPLMIVAIMINTLMVQIYPYLFPLSLLKLELLEFIRGPKEKCTKVFQPVAHCVLQYFVNLSPVATFLSKEDVADEIVFDESCNDFIGESGELISCIVKLL